MSKAVWKLYENGDGTWHLLEVHQHGGHIVTGRVTTEHLERALNIVRSLDGSKEADKLIKDITGAQR
jgi:hypothetical protein